MTSAWYLTCHIIAALGAILHIFFERQFDAYYDKVSLTDSSRKSFFWSPKLLFNLSPLLVVACTMEQNCPWLVFINVLLTVSVAVLTHLATRLTAANYSSFPPKLDLAYKHA